MTDLVIWAGPVAKYQVPGAEVPGAAEVWLSCTGDGALPPKCADVSAALGYPGPQLEAVAARAGLRPAQVDRIILGAHSAGGAVLARLLEDPDIWEKTVAVLLSDATYSSWTGSGQARRPAPRSVWAEFAVEVARSPNKVFLASASPSPNGTAPTGVETLREIRRQAEAKLGRSFEDTSGWFGVDPGPELVTRAGNVLFAEFPMEPHGHGHIKFAPTVWQQVFQNWPDSFWLPGGSLPEPPLPDPKKDSSDWFIWAALGVGALIGYHALKQWRR